MAGQLDLFGDEPHARADPDEVAPIEPDPRTEAIARRMPAHLHMGTSSWSFPGWKGLVWRDEQSNAQLARRGLAAYARHPLMRTVGVERTYYAPVPAGVLAAYAADVPPDFRFLVKAHDHCTMARFPGHPRYGEQRGQRNARFLDPAYAESEVVGPYVEGLGAKGGVLLFQLPPQDPELLGGAGAFAERLHRFLDALPRGPVYAVELRSPGLLGPDYAQAIASVGAVHCLNAWPGMPDLRQQYRATRVQGGEPPATVVRWMLNRRHDYGSAKVAYAPFDQLVDEDPATRETIARLILARLPRTYLIVNNKAEGSSPLSILALAERLVALMDED